jgi:hypothetical protein
MVPWSEHYETMMTVARVRGIVAAHRILNEIDRQFGKDTSDSDLLLDRIEKELGDE